MVLSRPFISLQQYLTWNKVMKINKKQIAGWILSGLISAFLIGVSAIPKFIEWEGKAEMFAKMGWTTEVMFYIGIVEASLAVLLLLPRAGFIGAVLLTAYLGGAVATHVRINDQFYFPIIIGVLVWVAMCLRDPRVVAVAFQPNSPQTH
jgi:hypothetical protein